MPKTRFAPRARLRCLFSPALLVATMTVAGAACAPPDGDPGTGTGTGGASGPCGVGGVGAGGKGSGGTGVGGGAAGASGTGGGGAAGRPGTGGNPGTGGSPGAGGRLGTGGMVVGPGMGGRGMGGVMAGTGGATTGSGGGTGTAAICNFASGLNIAWVNFANDVPNPNLAMFRTIFQNTYSAGGRVIRWWLHTNGTVTPGYDSSGMAQPIAQNVIDGIKSVLSAANTAGVSINISLWSFDMLQGGENISTGLRTNNQNLLTVDANRQAYIDRVLTPMVTALKGQAGLYSYEIFNEPEGMTNQNGWTKNNGGTQVDEMYIQKTVNWFAAAIHTADPTARVTNGSWTFKANANGVTGMTNYYSDSALAAAGGKANGTLDFYEVHYYMSNGSQYSPFLNAATHWGLDKKLVIGEFYARATDNVATTDLYTKLYSGGYNGAWAWQYVDGDNTVSWPTMQVPLQNMYNAHMADVVACRP